MTFLGQYLCCVYIFMLINPINAGINGVPMEKNATERAHIKGKCEFYEFVVLHYSKIICKNRTECPPGQQPKDGNYDRTDDWTCEKCPAGYVKHNAGHDMCTEIPLTSLHPVVGQPIFVRNRKSKKASPSHPTPYSGIIVVCVIIGLALITGIVGITWKKYRKWQQSQHIRLDEGEMLVDCADVQMQFTELDIGKTPVTGVVTYKKQYTGNQPGDQSTQDHL